MVLASFVGYHSCEGVGGETIVLMATNQLVELLGVALLLIVINKLSSASSYCCYIHFLPRSLLLAVRLNISVTNDIE